MPRRDRVSGGRTVDAEAAATDANAAARPAPDRPTPATTAAAQLAYEARFTNQLKLDYCFRKVNDLDDRLDERDREDRLVARILEHLRCQIANATLRAEEREEKYRTSQTQSLSRIEALIAALSAQLDALSRSHDEANLLSDAYHVQAVEALDLLRRTITYDVPRDIRTFAALTLAAESLDDSPVPAAPPVALASRERSVAAD